MVDGEMSRTCGGEKREGKEANESVIGLLAGRN